jgi:adenylylsulfate kinase-like enzyme
VDECARRDPKGLYMRALAGELPDFTGVSAPYEEPVAPDLEIDTEHEEPQACADRVIALLESRGLVR